MTHAESRYFTGWQWHARAAPAGCRADGVAATLHGWLHAENLCKAGCFDSEGLRRGDAAV